MVSGLYINMYFTFLRTDMDILQSVSSEVTTNQSGDYCKSNSSNNAINDLYSPQHAGNDTDLCRRCSVSTKQILNWWEVDLGRKHLIAGIRVYGRVDGEHLAYLTIYVFVNINVLPFCSYYTGLLVYKKNIFY